MHVNIQYTLKQCLRNADTTEFALNVYGHKYIPD